MNIIPGMIDAKLLLWLREEAARKRSNRMHRRNEKRCAKRQRARKQAHRDRLRNGRR